MWQFSCLISATFYDFFIENLEISSQTHTVDHTEIGRYFDKFCSTYYQPNAEKEREYPQDGAVRSHFLALTRPNTESLLGK